MDSTARPSYISIARIVRARGNRGEVLAELHTDYPARFSLLHQVWLEFPDGTRECVALENSWEHKGRQVLKLAGIDSISAAERLRGSWVQVEASQAISLPENTFWDHDLVGCTLRDPQGRHLGVVTSVMRIAGNSQLVVRWEQNEYLVPMVRSICRQISIERREIVVELPKGLMDLNQ